MDEEHESHLGSDVSSEGFPEEVVVQGSCYPGRLPLDFSSVVWFSLSKKATPQLVAFIKTLGGTFVNSAVESLACQQYVSTKLLHRLAEGV